MAKAIRLHKQGGPEVMLLEDIEVRQRYALKDAVQAHRDLGARKTTGSTLLVP